MSANIDLVDEAASDSTATKAAIRLTVETGGASFPVAGPVPELSWQLPAGVANQTRYELQARIGGATREHQADSGEHRFVLWPWEPLNSCERVSWRVRIHDEQGPHAWSEWARFEAGLFEEDWAGQWISPPVGADLPSGQRPAYALTSTFSVIQAPASARLYATALGVYEAFVNGRRVGSTELAPGTQSYDRTLYAQAEEVAELLHEGTNTVTLLLSDGWYRGRAGTFRRQAAWGEHTAVRAQLMVDDSAAGLSVVAATDTTWTVTDSTVVQADLMDGQTTDLTHTTAPLGHAIPGPRDAPAVSWSPAPPVRAVTERSPVSITRLSSDVIIVDFGQNASGWVRLASLGTAGSRTTLRFGEHLDVDGDLTTSHLDVVDPSGAPTVFVQQDVVISDGAPGAVFEPRHTIHGFQYVRLERADITLSADDITMRVVHTDFREVGAFDSSETDLIRLWDAAKWSFRGNAVDIPTDCPTRERAGWTGDWQVFLPTAVRLYDVNGFTRKWLQSVRDDQLDDGRIVNISPDNARLRHIADPMTDMATGSAGWGDAIVLVPWELYRTYGDRQVLEDCWDAMVRWVAFASDAAASKRHPSRIERSAQPQPHEKYIWDGTFHFGEWLEPTPLAEDGTPGPTMPDPMAWAMADKGEVGTAYLYRSTATLAKIAEVLGRADAAATYADTAEKIRDAWQTEFLVADARTKANTQASYVRGLAFGLFPESTRERAARHLVELIGDADTHLGTGFLSTADLLPVLADTGHAEVADELLRRRTSPSWLGMLDRGATTIWEEWEGVDRNGRASASLNHYSKGAVIRYLQTHTLGLRQAEDSVAWERIVVAPVVPAGMTWASGHFDGPQGRVGVRWDLEAGASLTVDVPASTRATLRWFDQETTVGPGRHTLYADSSASTSA